MPKFSMREKILIAAAAAALLCGGYVFGVDGPIRQEMAQTKAKAENLNQELAAVQEEQVQAQTETKENEGQSSYMPSYNSLDEEIEILNDVLSPAEEYSLQFEDVTLDGNQVRRGVSLRFTAPDYDTAEEMLRQLANSRIRCRLGNIQCSAAEGDSIEEGKVEITLSAAFYETLVGATTTAGLPEG